MQNLLDDLTEILQAEQAFISDGSILKNAVIEAALNMDPRLLELLMQSDTIKGHFFTPVARALVFDKVKFQDFVSNKAFLPDSYTAYQRTGSDTRAVAAFLAKTDSHLIGTMIVSLKGSFPLHTSAATTKLGQFWPKDAFMSETRIGYARCSTESQDLDAQRAALIGLGVAEDRIYTDHGLTGTNRERPGLAQALAAVREGDTLVVPKLDRLARSVPDARAIADELEKRGVKLALGASVHDPTDPMGKMFFNILATFAEFEADLIRMRTKEGMAIARSKGKLKGKKPKLSDKQQRELCRMHVTGEYSISDLAEVFSVSRPTVYRTLKRNQT